MCKGWAMMMVVEKKTGKMKTNKQINKGDAFVNINVMHAGEDKL